MPSTEIIIVPETQQRVPFIPNRISLETGSKKQNSKNEKKTKEMENKNHRKKKQKKILLKQKNNKQLEEEKEVKSQQEIVQPKIFNLSRKTLSRNQIDILLCGLRFTPTPKCNMIHLKTAFDKIFSQCTGK